MQTYLMIGAGGTGTHLLPALLTYLRNFHGNTNSEYQVVIADGDTFAPHNTDRQLFDAAHVALNKAEAMLAMYPDHPLIAVSRYLGAADLGRMMSDGDVVIICADNYSIRKLVADRANELQNIIVLNAGNEAYSGSVQLWVREHGKNVTPPITFGHPEIRFLAEDDRAAMTCAQVAALPGGGQTLIANMTAATYLLVALHRVHSVTYYQSYKPGWTEIHFDHAEGTYEPRDLRELRGWATA